MESQGCVDFLWIQSLQVVTPSMKLGPGGRFRLDASFHARGVVGH